MNIQLRFSSITSSFAARVIAVFAVAFSWLPQIHATPGDFDPTFGSGFGRVLFPVTARYDVAVATKRLPDGKRLIVGRCDTTASTTTLIAALCAMRLNDDGSVDTSYGTNGRSVVPYPAANGDAFVTARDILLDASDRATVLGYCAASNIAGFSAPCLARLNANGSIDSTFGNSGFALASFPSYFVQPDRLFRVADGKMLTSAGCQSAANSDQTAFCSFRVNADGSIDTSYGAGGIQVTFLALRSESVDAALLPDGTLLMGGRCRANEINPTPYQFCLLRVLANGSVDGSFGTGGQVFTTVSNNNAPFASSPSMTVHPDGLITLISHLCSPTAPETKQYCLVRYTANGTLIPTQGANVYRIPYFTGLLPQFSLNGATLQADGKYLLHGSCRDNNFVNSDFCLIRLHTDASFDTSFAGVGYLQTSISVNNTLGSEDIPAASVDLEANGKLAVVGSCVGAAGIDKQEAYDFCAARYELGPFNGSYCTLDIDGDGNVSASIDGLLNLRVMLGMTGASVVQGVPFASNAKRTNWSAIRKYLVEQCAMTLAP